MVAMVNLNKLKPMLQSSARSKRGRKAKPKAIYVSKKTEAFYLSQLLAIVKTCKQEIELQLLPVVRQHTVSDSKSIQVSDGILDIFLRVLSLVRSQLDGLVDSVAIDLAQRVIQQSKDATDKQLALLIYNATGIDVTGLLAAEDLVETLNEALAANVSLIKSIPKQYLDKVEQIVMLGLQTGQRAEQMVAKIQELHPISKNRAALVARDQVGKITSRLTQVRQQKMGITHYTWSTSQDERVRDTHRNRNGKLFAWSDPPDDGHPGMPIRCRCVAIPYTAHLFNADAPSPDDLMKSQSE